MYNFVTLYDNGNVIIQAEPQDNAVMMHCKVLDKFTKSDYVETVVAANTIADAFKENGYKELFCLIPKDDPTLYKFCNRLSMFELIEFRDHYLMRREII